MRYGVRGPRSKGPAGTNLAREGIVYASKECCVRSEVHEGAA